MLVGPRPRLGDEEVGCIVVEVADEGGVVRVRCVVVCSGLL